MENMLLKMNETFKKYVTYDIWVYYYNFFKLAIISGSININYLNIMSANLSNANVIVRDLNENKLYQNNLDDLKEYVNILEKSKTKGR